MIRKAGWLLAVTIVCFWLFSPLLAQRGRTASDGFFFLPSRSTFLFRPDLFFRNFHTFQGHRGGRSFFGGPSNHFFGFPHSFYGGPDTTITPRSRAVYQVWINSPAGNEVVRANSSDVIFKVTPPRAHVYIDDRLIGSAGDFSTDRDRYMLLSGEHTLRIEYPGFLPFETVMEVVPNRTLHLDIELERKPDSPR